MSSAAWGLDQKGVGLARPVAIWEATATSSLVYANYHAGVTVVLRNDNASGHRIIVDLRGTVSNRFGRGSDGAD